MKTTYLKIAAMLLGGACYFNPYFSDAKGKVNPSKGIKTRSISSRKISSKTLAGMKIKNIEFGFNKATVPSSAYENLDKVAKLMTDNNASVKLGGYADNKGGYVYNWKLSAARALAVKNYLVSRGSDSTRIAAVEYGYTHPIAPNSTAAGRKKNRRVEIHFAE
jgi:outer membrane protein OmpA-like peptidoglycan-associated protein